MELWLVGDGPLRPVVEKTVVEMGLEGRVLFLGVRNDVPKLLACSDVLVLSSEYEGAPLTVLEARQAGKPVIATAVGGVPELVEDGVTGILAPPRNPEALAQGILRLAKDADLRQRMGKAAQQWALERFDIARTAREYEALYLRLLREWGRAMTRFARWPYLFLRWAKRVGRPEPLPPAPAPGQSLPPGRVGWLLQRPNGEDPLDWAQRRGGNPDKRPGGWSQDLLCHNGCTEGPSHWDKWLLTCNSRDREEFLRLSRWL